MFVLATTANVIYQTHNYCVFLTLPSLVVGSILCPTVFGQPVKQKRLCGSFFVQTVRVPNTIAMDGFTCVGVKIHTDTYREKQLTK